VVGVGLGVSSGVGVGSIVGISVGLGLQPAIRRSRIANRVRSLLLVMMIFINAI
jgi:F0F1-type ATP synthase membrane subunit c/vacuolar-type H+-ATPase subunit K